MTRFGWVKFPVYTFSGDLGSDTSSCTAISARAAPGLAVHRRITWLQRRPGLGVGVTSLPSGLSQITWNGDPPTWVQQ